MIIIKQNNYRLPSDMYYMIEHTLAQYTTPKNKNDPLTCKKESISPGGSNTFYVIISTKLILSNFVLLVLKVNKTAVRRYIVGADINNNL